MNDSKPVIEIKGTDGVLIVYEDRLILKRKNISSLILKGSKGNRTYFYDNITTVEFKKPSIGGWGYFRVIAPGTQRKDLKKNMLFASVNDISDDNTIVFRSKGDSLERANDYILDRIRNSKNAQSVSPYSAADEIFKFKELLEQGVITEEEFENKKRELLK